MRMVGALAKTIIIPIDQMRYENSCNLCIMNIDLKNVHEKIQFSKNVIGRISFQSPEGSEYSDDVSGTNGGKLNNDGATLTDKKRPTIDLRHKGSSHAHNVSIQKKFKTQLNETHFVD